MTPSGTPIVSIVGRSGSGKTTLLEKLIPELKSKGYRVATIKHTDKTVTVDEPGKDSWRHVEAGSEAVILSSPQRATMLKPVPAGASLAEMVRFLGEEYDIVLAEGFKTDSVAKIEVHRGESGPPLDDIGHVVAVASDEPRDTAVRQFSLEDVAGIAGFVEEEFIRPNRERLALYVNGAPVELKAFPRDIIGNVVTAMASCLRGVGDIRTLKFILKKGPAAGESQTQHREGDHSP